MLNLVNQLNQLFHLPLRLLKGIAKISIVLARTGKISKTFKFLHPTAFKQISKIAGGFKKIYSVGKATFSFMALLNGDEHVSINGIIVSKLDFIYFRDFYEWNL